MNKVEVKLLNVFYGSNHILHDVSLSIKKNEVVSIIGASGCGKSTFLRCLNRMNDYSDDFSIKGLIKLDGKDIYSIEISELCMKVGMVFQKPVPFPKSIYDNVAYGPMIHSMYKSKEELDFIVEDSLKKASLYDEVKHNLKDSALKLSGGQQQRLCIARAIAIKPEVILMDEPCASLDPISTAKMESLIDELKQKFTIVIITHSMQQAARVSDKTAFFHMGCLVEYDCTEKIFTSPKNKKTQEYITGRFG